MAGIADTILAQSGNKRVKMVWHQDRSATQDDRKGDLCESRLYTYDTADDTIRDVSGQNDCYVKPLITFDGARIVFIMGIGDAWMSGAISDNLFKGSSIEFDASGLGIAVATLPDIRHNTWRTEKSSRSSPPWTPTAGRSANSVTGPGSMPAAGSFPTWSGRQAARAN